MTTTHKVLLAVLAGLALATAFALHAQRSQAPQTITLDAQGHSPEWEQSRHWRDFYTLSVEMLRGNASPDVAAFEQKSYEIFREFAREMGASPEAMIEHLKNIPREVVFIAKDDPKVLDSYDNFMVALRGPR